MRLDICLVNEYGGRILGLALDLVAVLREALCLIPADLKDEAETLRQELIEKAAEFDDTLMERFFEQGSLSEDIEIRFVGD